MNGVFLNVNVFSTLPLVCWLDAGVDTLVQQLASITPDMLKDPDYEDDIENLAPRFEIFFCQLRLLLSDNVETLDDEITLPAAKLSLQPDTPIFFPEKLLV